MLQNGFIIPQIGFKFDSIKHKKKVPIMLYVCCNNEKRSESNRAIPGMKPGSNRNETGSQLGHDADAVTTRSRRGQVTTRLRRDHNTATTYHGHNTITRRSRRGITRLLRRLRRVYLVFLTLFKTCILKILIFLSCFMSCFGAATAG